MDFVPRAALAHITVDLDFYDTPEHLAYRGTTFFGYVGLWTVLNPHKFAVTMNERTWGSVVDNMASIFTAAKESQRSGHDSSIVPIAIAARRSAEFCDSYRMC